MVDYIRKTLDSKAFRGRFRRKDADFSRRKVWTFERVFTIVLRGLIKAASRETCDFIDLLEDPDLPLNVGASGLCKAREKLKYQVFRELIRRTSRHFYRHCHSRITEGGYRLLGIDTSILLVPEAPAMRRRFGPKRQGPGREGQPQARLSLMMDLHNGVILDAYCSSTREGDRRLATRHFNCLAENDIVVLDRGYFGHDYMDRLLALPCHVVLRVRLGADQQVRRFVASGAASATLVYRGEPVRAVRVILPGGGLEVLLTTLNSPDLDADFFREIYAARWGVETHFMHLKQALELARFSGKSVNKVLQDVYGKCLGMSLLNMIGADAKAAIHATSTPCKNRRRLCVVDALNQLRSHLPRLLLGADTAILTTLIRLTDRLRHCQSPIRPERSFPRKIGRYHPRFPTNRKPA